MAGALPVSRPHSQQLLGEEQARRAAVRRIAAGVTVLTAVHDGQVHGVTASAVTAASNEPLLVCVCLRNGSTFAKLAAQARRFLINVLSGRQAPVADWFADPRRPSGYGQFAPLGWTPDPVSAAPLLRGALAWLDCQLMFSYPAGDHSILLAEVLGGASGTGDPLLSFDRQLHSTELLSVSRRNTQGAAGPGIITLD
jgi:flavin reductase (DIM6/NTAB) family NADH-FMN oxidoreductase RutF